MDAGLIGRIENGAERCAAALFAAAVAYAAYGVVAAAGFLSPVAFCAAGAGALAYWPCSRALAAGRRSPSFLVPHFAVAAFEFGGPAQELLLTDRLAPDDELLLTERVASAGELLLTDADRVDGPLLLDDILAQLGPESRVVRLFDRKAMSAPPTAGELQSRIAGHLREGAPRSAPSDTPAPSDASEALSAALAELRRSLR
jgi:hypothetical protein